MTHWILQGLTAFGCAATLTHLAVRPASAQPSPAASPAAIVPAEADWWFPELPLPAAIVRTSIASEIDGPVPEDRRLIQRDGPIPMLVQSAAGLAARGVRLGTHDEMVWVDEENPNQQLAYDRLQKRLGLEVRDTLEPWDLVRRLKDAGVVKGYIVYRQSSRRGRRIDPSANVATSVAGPLGGVLVEESLEDEAKALGLEMLLDAREHDEAWVFEHFKDQLNRRMALFQNPRMPQCRDYAIAHDVIALYGDGELEREVLAWLEPLSPMLGWNRGDEGENARMFSQYGHFNTATDWAMNLPVLSAGARQAEPARLPDEPQHEVEGGEPVVSFVMSDGDNLQWMTQNFFRDYRPRYWENPHREDFPLTWTLCLANMRQAAPDLLAHTAETIPGNASAVEFGGGYYFPDRFGELRDEPDLLAKQARKTWANMEAFNSDVLCLIFDDLEGDAAREAMQVYADEMPGLKGILAMDFYPYSQGEGDVYWIDREDGTALPVVTARLELRTDFKLPTTGGVDFVAEMLNESPLPVQWVVQHAWSDFAIPGSDGGEDDEVSGLEGTAWTVEKLDGRANLVTAGQMFDQLERPAAQE